MDEFFIHTILDVVGASARFLFFKIFGSKNRFLSYLDDEYSALNILIGFVILAMIIVVLLLNFIF